MRSLVVCLGFLAFSIACGASVVLAGKKADGGPTDLCLVSVETVDAAGKHGHPALPVSPTVGVDGGSQPSGDGDVPVAGLSRERRLPDQPERGQGCAGAVVVR